MSARLDHIAVEVGDFDDRIAMLQRLGMVVRRVGSLSADPGRRIAMLSDQRGFKLELIESGADGLAHLAFEVDDVYGLCEHLSARGSTILRPPRDGRMAFVRSPDQISIELLQRGEPLPPAEPWASMPSTGSW